MAVARISGFVAEVSEKYGVEEWGNFSGCAGAGRSFLFISEVRVRREWEWEWGRTHGPMAAGADLEERVRDGYLRGYKSVCDFFGKYLRLKVGDGGRSISSQPKAQNELFEELKLIA